MSEPTQEQPRVTATVSPAPPPKSRWNAIPHHLGRARTSTVILSVLFLAIGALWLNVRPDPDRPAVTSGGGGTVVDQPAGTEPAVPTTPAPATDPVPTTASEPTTTSEVPTTTSEGTAPTETGTGSPTTSEAPEPLPEPTGTPTG